MKYKFTLNELMFNFKDSKIIMIFVCIKKKAKPDLSVVELMELSSYSRKTIDKIITHLVNMKLIKLTRTIGKTNMYK